MLSLTNYSCCNTYDVSISAHLDKALFGNSLRQVILDRYDRMRVCRDRGHKDQKWNQNSGTIINSKDVLLKVDIRNIPSLNYLTRYSNVGHDLPYWIEAGDEERVMFVSQDPLRSEKDPDSITLDPLRSEKAPVSITFSSPFGIHSKDYRGNKLITRIVENLIGKGFSVYLTDFHKLYATDGNKKVTFSSYDPYDILTYEIGIFKPTTIVTIGKLAKDELLQMGISEAIKIRHIPHPNAAINCLEIEDLKQLLQLLS